MERALRVVLSVILVAGILLGCREKVQPNGGPSVARGGAEEATSAGGGDPGKVGSWPPSREVLAEMWKQWEIDPAKVEAPLPTATLAVPDGKKLLLLSLPSLRSETAFDAEAVGRAIPHPFGGVSSIFTPSPAARGWLVVAAVWLPAPPPGVEYPASVEWPQMCLARWHMESGKIVQFLPFSGPPQRAWPSQSPDGRFLAFLEGPITSVAPLCKVCVAEMTGSGIASAQTLPPVVYCQYVQWLPDSRSFLFTAKDDCVYRFNVETGELTKYPVKGMVTVLPGGDSIALIENGGMLRVLSFPEFEVRSERRLREPGTRDAQAVAIDESTVAYPGATIYPFGTHVIVVGLGENAYQVPVYRVAGPCHGLALVPVPAGEGGKKLGRHEAEGVW